ncbi:transglycosylase domain-containing protein [Metabacillus herbersteinensis]|uniref:Transglycosylase domain-containing protein n=1 Tax=Metabacillus herbersteinensis TaxID=283816 RepID=A0ABV6GBG4_9BACI
MLPIFLVIVLGAAKEVNEVKSIGSVLDEKIPIQSIQLTQNSYIYDDKGQLVSEIISEHENRRFVPYEQIPDTVKNLYLVSEDQQFFSHLGFDPASMVRAVFINAKNQSIDQGGSTITQQLARNVYLSHEKTYNRKLSELLYSYQLERNFTKEEIFESYLNTIYYANGVYGIGSAADYYFSKSLQKLSLAELAFISTIPNNPTLYDPIKNFSSTKVRQELLLATLLKHELLEEEKYKQAIQQPITLKMKKRVDVYPDYVTYVHEELNKLITHNDGLRGNELKDHINQVVSNGIIIHTALNSSMQKKVTTTINQQLPFKDVQGAAVVVNHQTHRIVALTGGKNYQKFSFNRAYQAYRQPGSAIKPLLDYAPYIDTTGATAKSKISAATFCKVDYCPQNYSGHSYGNVSLETALKYSYNTSAVRLLDIVGLKKAFSYLEPFAFEHISVQDDLYLPAAIGGFTYGVSPLELTNAYSTFATDGVFHKNRAIVKVTDLQGKTLYEWKDQPVSAWKSSTNKEMRTLLTAVVKSGTGKKAQVANSYVGGKTGTSNDYRDLWFVGMTDQYTAGVWVGKDKKGTVQSIYNIGPQMLIWKNIME